MRADKQFSFLPMFPEEITKKGWQGLDVLIVTGDPYVDHPAYGSAVIGRVLEARGYRVGIIAQPDWNKADDFKRLGRPRLCACVTAGNVDSMIANYTANKRKRSNDSGGKGYLEKRPDRATIVYVNRLRAAFKNLPIVIGGIEASLRRLAHYDYWDDAPRRSLLLDAKADILIYGMGERQICEVVDRLNQNEPISQIRNVRGTVVRVNKEDIPEHVVTLPSFEEVCQSPQAFNQAFSQAYRQMNPFAAQPLVQAHAQQYVLQLPPALPLSVPELDASYALPYQRTWHPFYDTFAGVNGFETVRWSIVAMRGCPGECSFCGLTMHQGRIVQSRSEQSILKEATSLAEHPGFRGTITDIGGPTANLYGAYCDQTKKQGPCSHKQCLMPEQCSSFKIPYQKILQLYEAIRQIPKVKHVFVSSGLRYDLLLDPEAKEYLRRLCAYHISGQMKVAPEHTDDEVLAIMNKPSYRQYEAFVKEFERVNKQLQKRTYLVNYFISAHPASRLENAFSCATKLLSRRMRPEQVQDFLPLPMTVSGCIYHTGLHPLTGQQVYVPKSHEERVLQRALIQSQNAQNRPLIRKALRKLNKEHLARQFGLRAQPR